LLSIVLRTLYTRITHPVGFLIVILTQALIVCLISWVTIKSRWFSFIIFLIFLGGLIVLFIYITSLASNEIIYSLSYESTYNLIFIAFTPVLYIIFSRKEIIHSNVTDLSKIVYIIYRPGFEILIIFSMVYLLLTLIIVVKIADQFDAPIKTLIN